MSFPAASGQTSRASWPSALTMSGLAPCVRSHAAVGHCRLRHASWSGVSPCESVESTLMPSPMPCSRTMRRLLRLPRAAAANSADVLDGVLGGFAIAVRFRNQTTNKFPDQFNSIRHRAAVARARVRSPLRPYRVYERLAKGFRVLRRVADTRIRAQTVALASHSPN